MSSLAAIAASLFIGLLIWGSMAKAAAYLNRKTTLSWSHAFVFAALLFVLVVICRVVLSTASVPLAANFGLSALLVFALGGWFFSSRAKNQDGGPVGLGGALRLSGFFVLIGAVMAAVGLLVLKLVR